MKTKHVYWLTSGEGEIGTFERVVTTSLGIKQRLTRERCFGDRSAHAYSDMFVSDCRQVYGYDVETGNIGLLPDKAKRDVVKSVA